MMGRHRVVDLRYDSVECVLQETPTQSAQYRDARTQQEAVSMNWTDIGVVFGYVVVVLTVVVVVLLVAVLFVFSIKGDYQEETRSKMTGNKNIDLRT